MLSIAQQRMYTLTLIEQPFEKQLDEWPRDWKSRRRQKRLEGSNPSFSAMVIL